MSFRYMRVIVFFDLPSITLSEKKQYRQFRKFLLKSGFIMVQESVYSKLALNTTVANAISEKVRKNKPSTGLIQLLTITENQYSRMEFIIGEKTGDVIDSEERLIIL